MKPQYVPDATQVKNLEAAIKRESGANAAQLSEIMKRTESDLLRKYSDTTMRLETNIQLQALLLLLGAVLLLRGDPAQSSENFFGVSVSSRWAHLFVPSVALWVWLQFGFIYESAITQRLALDALFQAKYAVVSDADFMKTCQRALLRDNSLVDSWFACWRERTESTITIDSAVARWMLIPVHGLFFGTSHAVMLCAALVGKHRFSDEKGLSRLLEALWWIVVVALLSSHVLFLYIGPHPNAFQHAIAMVSLIVLFACLCADSRRRPVPQYECDG